MKELNIVTARKRNCQMTAENAQNAVEELARKDKNAKKGPAYIQETLQRRGIHIPL